MGRKTTKFRQGQKMEVGFDLKRNHTGKQGTGSKMTTAEGEMISNYMEQGDCLKTEKPKKK